MFEGQNLAYKKGKIKEYLRAIQLKVLLRTIPYISFFESLVSTYVWHNGLE
jgi:hypothetical protein